MTPRPSTQLPAHIYYGIIADHESRDPVQSVLNRATVPMGRGFALWQRMNAGVDLVWVDDMEGRARALTPKQAQVASLAMSMVDGEMMTMRDMAKELQVAPSTVSRALTRLAAWGILAYVVGRGRWAGLVIMRRVKGDNLGRFRDAALARLRGWRLAAERRLSRLERNVAPYLHERLVGREVDSLYYYLVTTSKSATLTAQLPWTAADMAEIV